VADGPIVELLGNSELMAAHRLEVPLSLRLGGRLEKHIDPGSEPEA
jgi:hypothetical protein